MVSITLGTVVQTAVNGCGGTGPLFLSSIYPIDDHPSLGKNIHTQQDHVILSLLEEDPNFHEMPMYTWLVVLIRT